MGTTLLERPDVEGADSNGVGGISPEVAVAPQPETASKSVEPSTMDLMRDNFGIGHAATGKIDWKTLGWMILMHAGCLAAPFFFSWSGLAIAFVLYYLTGTIGICLCYHRYLAHKSFKLAKPAEAVVQLCGVLALQGGPLTWSATHRVHHARSDKEGDPHSPREGKWWSHILWLFIDKVGTRDPKFLNRIIPDLMKDPMSVFFEKTFFLWTALLAIGLYAAGGWSWLLWGLCVRMVFTYHVTWFVNSATHLWGYRTYQTTDDSKNLWWVALLTGGEGWHNNHHAYPRIARAGHKWWEIDTTFWVISFLRSIGQAWDVNDKLPDTTRRSSPAAVQH